MARLSYDLHIHSCLSPCGDDENTPGNIVGMSMVIGLDLIALTDHNTCRNCPAFVAAANEYGMMVICGMELTTAEEVHVLCYFPTLEDAMRFDAYVYDHLPDTDNIPAFFGNQYQYNEQDQIYATEPKLLISATDIPFDDVYDLVKSFGGIMVPAHINKKTTSLLGNLGFVPEGSKFDCFELHDLNDLEALRSKHPYLKDCNVLCSSDAHDLNTLHEPIYFLETESEDIHDILKAISKM